MANILIVDDDELLCEHLAIHLTAENHKVYSANGAGIAWRFVRGHNIHVILLDINMPGQNGLEFLESLRNNDQYSSIPVIMMSTNSKVETFQQARKIGIVDYIVKPATPQVVSSKLKHAIQQLALISQQEKQRYSEHLLVSVKEKMVVFTFPSDIDKLTVQYLRKKMDAKFRESIRGKSCLFDFQFQEHFDASQAKLVAEMYHLTKPNKAVFIAGRNYTVLLTLDIDPENQLFISMEDYMHKVKPDKTPASN